MKSSREKYLLLYLRTGGGHLAPARSIAEQITKLDSNIEPVLIDGFEKSPAIVKAVIEGGYRKLQHKAKWFYELLYAVYKFKFIAALSAWIISAFSKDYIYEVIHKEEPAKIIIFHFFLIKPVMTVLKERRLDIKTITIVTDPFTAHPLWFLNKKQNFIVFSTQLKNHCIAMGIKEWRIKVFPFILDEKFSNTPDKETIVKLKEKYSVDRTKNVILVLGGGDGIPKGKKILRILLDNYNDKEIIIICGKNKSLYNRAMQMKEQGDIGYLKVFGYVDFVYDLINISDVVITKCGASTFMEIIISRKIPVVTSYIWEQEKGNKDYIVQNGMGVYVKDLKQLPDLINRVSKNIHFYKTNIDKAGIKNGAEEVAKYLINNDLTT
jgi:UDP-N-acetylglucosamine:LPS N-acetylglucosamine transferase